MLQVAAIQSELIWENPKANLEALSLRIQALSNEVDIVILPEMFTTGFTMEPNKVAESMSGATVTWMQEMASAKQAVICGSVIIEEQNKFYNRLLWISPDGNVDYYDKKHLFTLAGEHKAFEGGTEKKIFEYKGWKICAMVCYDLRFPAWARNVEDYGLLIYVANWPNTRSHHWKTLLQARAIENQCYTIGVNRVGTDANGLVYSGDSAIVDYSGQVLSQASEQPATLQAQLSKTALATFRSKLDFLADRDEIIVR